MARVLIVDDRSTNRHYLRQVLSSDNHEVVEAGDGAQALACVREAVPQLLITDLLMPVMGGFELVRQLRADPATAQIPVIFYTATYRSTDAHRLAKACGVSVVLPKPTDPRTLLAAVNHLLGMAPPTMPAAPAPAGHDGATPLAALGERIAGHIGSVHSDHALLHGLLRAQAEQGPEREGLDAMLQRFETHLGRVQHSASRVFALIELALDLAVERDLGAFLRMFCDAGRRIVDADAVALLLFDADEQRVRRAEATGLPEGALSALRAASLREGLVDRARTADKALRMGDGQTTLAGLPAAGFDAPPTRALLSVPLDSSTDRFGLLLFLDHRAGRVFDDEAEMLALALAGEFSVLFELFDANEALQRRAVELQLEVSQRQQAEQALEQHRRELASFSQRLLEQEKATTRRLAQALHDELGQTLAAMRLIYDACAAPNGGASPPNGLMRQLDQLIDDANRQVRQVLVDLRPPLLDEHGLAAALDNELRQRERLTGGAALELRASLVPPDQRWPPEVEYAAFMIAREAVQNALRHAGSSTVRVELAAADGGGFALSVGDDGCGLPRNPMPASTAGHLGMVGMRERAVAIGATLDVRSTPGQGTLVQLHWRGSE